MSKTRIQVVFWISAAGVFTGALGFLLAIVFGVADRRVPNRNDLHGFEGKFVSQYMSYPYKGDPHFNIELESEHAGRTVLSQTLLKCTEKLRFQSGDLVSGLSETGKHLDRFWELEKNSRVQVSYAELVGCSKEFARHRLLICAYFIAVGLISSPFLLASRKKLVEADPRRAS